MTPAEIRSARAARRMSQGLLADLAAVSVSSVRRLEDDDPAVSGSVIPAIRAAVERVFGCGE